MRFIEKISNFAFPLNTKHCKTALLAGLLLTGVTSCGSSSDSSTDTGFVKVYNASIDSPAIYLTIEDTDYTSINFGESTSLYEITTGTYDLALSYKVDDNDFTFIYGDDDTDTDTNDLKITNEDVDLFVVSGNIDDPVVTHFEYEDENPDDDTYEFALRFINTLDDNIEVYVSDDDETFAEAISLTSLASLQMSDSLYQDTDSYKFYLSNDNGATAVYESESITFAYTSQYVFMVRENSGPGDSPYTLDILSKSLSAVEYPDIEAVAEVRIYNGLSVSEEDTSLDALITSGGQIDLNIEASGVTTNLASALDKGAFSTTVSFDANDYALYITATGESETLTENNRFISLEKNSDKTVFLYTDEVKDYTSDDDNDDTTYEVEAVVRTLIESNIASTSLYDHTIKVINLVDDFSVLGVYFLASDEEISTATYSLTSSFANTKTITIPNNTYNIRILASENDETILLDSTEYTFNTESGSKFMIIEEDDTSATGYKVTFAPGNDEAGD